MGTPRRRSVPSGAATRRSIPRSRGHETTASTGSSAPAATSAPLSPNASTSRRRQQRPDAHSGQQERLERAKGAGEHVVGDGALEQRRRGDVDERVTEPDQREAERHEGELRKTGDQGQRPAVEGQSEAEVSGQTPAADEREHDRPADDAADPLGRIERADGGITGPVTSIAVITTNTFIAPPTSACTT